MSKKLGILVMLLTTGLGTGCCWFDQCGGCYNQCGGAYDPCTGLVYNQCDPYQGYRSKRIWKKHHKDHCDCDRHHSNYHHGGCNCNHGMPMRGPMMNPGGCPTCQSYGQPAYGGPIYGEPIYGEPIYGEPVETYYQSESVPELMVPQDMQPSKVVPAPPADEPTPLPAPEDSSIPPVSYEVPAPLDGPSVPVLQPYHGG